MSALIDGSATLTIVASMIASVVASPRKTKAPLGLVPAGLVPVRLVPVGLAPVALELAVLVPDGTSGSREPLPLDARVPISTALRVAYAKFN